MKSQISSVDLHYLIKEMQFLERGKIDKIYHPEKEELILQFHVSNSGKKILRIISGKFIFLSDYKGRYDAPSGFCMFLRKKLANARLRGISQVGSERICLLVFEVKEGKYRMYIELFGKGNIILTDENDIIINALEQKKWADREIKKNNKYAYPKKEHNFFNIKKEEFGKVLDSGKELVYGLARDIGVGGTYAEEICYTSSIDKKKKSLSKEEIEKVFKAFEGIINKDIGACVVYKEDKIKDIVPFELEIYNKANKKSFGSFNEAFDYFFKEECADKEEFKSKHQLDIDKTKKILEQQTRQIKDMEKKAKDNTKKGEMIYENYQLVENILDEINKAKGKYSFNEIGKKLKGHKIIKRVDGKNKKVVIEL